MTAKNKSNWAIHIIIHSYIQEGGRGEGRVTGNQASGQYTLPSTHIYGRKGGGSEGLWFNLQPLGGYRAFVLEGFVI